MTSLRERVSFVGTGGAMLAARLDRPAVEPWAWALFAHCFTCSKDLRAANRISRALVARGVAVLRFDFTGLGESEGDFADTNFSSNLDDLLAAAGYLREHHRAPQILIGHSLGGAAVLAAAGKIPESTAVAVIGAPSEPQHLRKTLANAAPEVDRRGEAELLLGGRRFRIKKQLLDDLERHTLEQTIGSLRRALLVLHSPVDEVVGIEHAAQIYRAARHPKSFVSLDDADHLLTRERDAVYAAEVLAAWAARYVEPPTVDAPEPAEEGEVTVNGGSRGFFNVVQAGHHRLFADEPARVGGNDFGPNPYDLLLAGLGACTSMTLRMYADRKQLPLDEVAVRLKHSRVHARDCADCESEQGMVDVIDREIRIEGQLTDAQHARMLEIADMCPVHRTLTTETRIRTRRAD